MKSSQHIKAWTSSLFLRGVAMKLDNQLWHFAVDFYGRPGVSEACLTMQNEAKLDVANLIAVIYADIALQQPLSATEIGQLCDLTSTWHISVVLPLREVRTSLKDPTAGFPSEKEALRERVKANELKAEQLQLRMVEEWLDARVPQSGLQLSDAQLTLLRLYEYPEGSAERMDSALATITAAANAWTEERTRRMHSAELFLPH